MSCVTLLSSVYTFPPIESTLELKVVTSLFNFLIDSSIVNSAYGSINSLEKKNFPKSEITSLKILFGISSICLNVSLIEPVLLLVKVLVLVSVLLLLYFCWLEE